MKKIMTTAVC